MKLNESPSSGQKMFHVYERKDEQHYDKKPRFSPLFCSHTRTLPMTYSYQSQAPNIIQFYCV